MGKWYKADGDEECKSCHRQVSCGEEVHYDKETDKLLCVPCVDKQEDELIGKLDSEDPRYSQEGEC